MAVFVSICVVYYTNGNISPLAIVLRINALAVFCATGLTICFMPADFWRFSASDVVCQLVCNQCRAHTSTLNMQKI